MASSARSLLTADAKDEERTSETKKRKITRDHGSLSDMPPSIVRNCVAACVVAPCRVAACMHVSTDEAPEIQASDTTVVASRWLYADLALCVTLN